MEAEINIALKISQGEMLDDDRLSYELDLCQKEQLSQHLLEAFCCYFGTENLLLSVNKDLYIIDQKEKMLADSIPWQRVLGAVEQIKCPSNCGHSQVGSYKMQVIKVFLTDFLESERP